MKRSTLLLSLGLIAALGIILGLVFHVGEEWHHDRKSQQEYASIPGRFPLSQFTIGTCGEAGFGLNQDALNEHIETLGEDLELSEMQVDLIGQLILGRAQAGCDIRLSRAEIRAAIGEDPLSNPETARPFVQSLLDFRQNLTEEALREIQVQRQLLNTLTDDQFESIDRRTLPRLVPGLSLREFTGQSPSRGGQGRPHR